MIDIYNSVGKTSCKFIEDYRFKFTWTHNHVIIFWVSSSISLISVYLLDYLLF